MTKKNFDEKMETIFTCLREGGFFLEKNRKHYEVEVRRKPETTKKNRPEPDMIVQKKDRIGQVSAFFPLDRVRFGPRSH